MCTSAVVSSYALPVSTFAVGFHGHGVVADAIPEMTPWHVALTVLLLLLVLAGVVIAIVILIKDPPHPTGNQWLGLAAVVAINAPFLGWLMSTHDLRPTLVILAIAFVFLIQGLITKRSEGLRVVRRLRNQCVECSYDLTGNESGICPECGTVIANDV